MLAFMSPPLPIHTPTDSSTMSLARLPSQPMAYSEPLAPTLSSTRPSPAKRPRLSLDTNNVPSLFSTSLRLETLSTTSPTARNTFRNAYNSKVQHRTFSKPVLSPLSTTTTQQTANSESAASSASTTTSVSSIDSISSVIPYKLAYKHTSSILINSPIPRAPRRVPFARARMFSATKKVAFKEPLTEDVKTTHFTLRHSDIESSTSTISTLELSPQSTAEQDDKSHPASLHTGDKRESSDEEGRRTQRQWVWTLASGESVKGQLQQPAKAGTAEGKGSDR